MIIWWHLLRLSYPGSGQVGAARKLAQSKDPRALTALIYTAMADHDPKLRFEVSRALFATGNPLAQKLLRAALDPQHWPAVEPDVTVLAKTAHRKYLASYISVFGRPDHWSNTRAERAANALEAGGWCPTCPDDHAALAVARKEWSKAAIEGSAAVGILACAMSHGDLAHRADAARALMLTAAPSASKMLIANFSGPGKLTSQIARFLGTMGDSNAIEWLANLLNSPNSDSFQDSVDALLAIGTESAFGALRGVRPTSLIQKLHELNREGGNFKYLRDILGNSAEDADLRVAAMWALTRLPASRSTEILLGVVRRNESFRLTDTATDALLKTRDLKAIRELIELRYDPKIVHAILRLGDNELAQTAVDKFHEGGVPWALLCNVLEYKPSVISTGDLQRILQLQDVEEVVYPPVWNDVADRYETDVTPGRCYGEFRNLAANELRRRNVAARSWSAGSGTERFSRSGQPAPPGGQRGPLPANGGLRPRKEK